MQVHVIIAYLKVYAKYVDQRHKITAQWLITQ